MTYEAGRAPCFLASSTEKEPGTGRTRLAHTPHIEHLFGITRVVITPT
jgi:hypothetical protein